uniref:Wsv094 n=1 Tax=Echinococcus granulosus TaxID=6210 RepID=A0A068WWE4_ECHGR|nr:hypothetical protein EgrG_002023600 [Echinococcus granulosus]
MHAWATWGMMHTACSHPILPHIYQAKITQRRVGENKGPKHMLKTNEDGCEGYNYTVHSIPLLFSLFCSSFASSSFSSSSSSSSSSSFPLASPTKYSPESRENKEGKHVLMVNEDGCLFSILLFLLFLLFVFVIFDRMQIHPQLRSLHQPTDPS